MKESKNKNSPILYHSPFDASILGWYFRKFTQDTNTVVRYMVVECRELGLFFKDIDNYEWNYQLKTE